MPLYFVLIHVPYTLLPTLLVPFCILKTLIGRCGVRIFNPRTQEVEAGLGGDWSLGVQGQPGHLQREKQNKQQQPKLL